MTHEQVHYLIGTPIAASAFRPNRWDYVGYYKSPRGEVTERIVSLYSADNVLARMDGIAKQGETKETDNTDVSTGNAYAKKDANDESRAESLPPNGVVLMTLKHDAYNYAKEP